MDKCGFIGGVVDAGDGIVPSHVVGVHDSCSFGRSDVAGRFGSAGGLLSPVFVGA